MSGDTRICRDTSGYIRIHKDMCKPLIHDNGASIHCSGQVEIQNAIQEVKAEV